MTALRSVTLLLLIGLLGAPAASAADPAPVERAGSPDTDRYVVVLRDSVSAEAETDQLERREGFQAGLRYGRALKGFAARLSDSQLARVNKDPDVAFVSKDRPVKALSVPIASGDTAPSGVLRIGAAGAGAVRQASKVNVAVIDTGIDLSHPDLNAVSGKNCISSGSTAQDNQGHGTHVAGTIGARNNGSGVVGVAPGTRLSAVKVLDAQGSGTMSQVICGIDWVAGTRSDGDPSNDIAVANMSLGGSGPTVGTCATTTDAEHKAICNATAKGVTFVVAAGNDALDFDYPSQPDTPAAFPEVLTVTAMGDSNGLPGGSGPAPGCRTGEADDRYASFSNYASTAGGRAHTIAGPGVCILSTRLGGGLTTFSGTSMASPHMAGAVALCVGEGTTNGPCAGLTPGAIVQKVISDAQAYNTASGNSAWGFVGDPLRAISGRYFGYLAFAGGSGGSTPTPDPDPTPVSASPASVTLETGSLRGGSAASLSADDTAFYSVNAGITSPRTTSWFGSFTGVPSSPSSLKISYKGSNSASCTQTLSAWNFQASAWTQLDSRSVGGTQVLVERSPTGTLSSYVGPGGEVRARVRCTGTSLFAFVNNGNLLRITYAQ